MIRVFRTAPAEGTAGTVVEADQWAEADATAEMAVAVAAAPNDG
jgi:hypothetical protein